MEHDTPHRWAGKEIRIKPAAPLLDMNSDVIDDDVYVVEDWWDRVSGGSWTTSPTPAAFAYAMRTVVGRIPIDDEVVYGKVGAFGHLLHKTELHSLIGPRDEEGDR